MPTTSGPDQHLHPSWRQLVPLLGYLRPYRLTLALALVATVLASVLSLVYPGMVGHLLDTADPATVQRANLNHLALALAAVFVSRAALSMAQAYLLSAVGEGVVNDLRCALYDHLINRPMAFYDRHHTGELTSRLSTDVVTVQAAMSSALSQLLGQGLVLVGGVAVLIGMSAELAVIMLASLPVVIVSGLWFGRGLKRASAALQTREAMTHAHAQETLGNVRVVQAFVAEHGEQRRYRALARAALDEALRRARISAAYTPSVTLLMAIGASGVLWRGGQLVQNGTLSMGTLIAFLLYTVTVITTVANLAGVYGQLQQALGASERVFALLGDTTELPISTQPHVLQRAQGLVKFEQVSFGYTEAGPLVLRDFELTLRPGELVALVGPSGAGKSTVAALTARLYDPTQGRILIDGLDLRDLDVHAWRRQLGWVAQDVQLFSGSVRDNLSYGRPDVTDQQVGAAARAANAHAFIHALPQGYATPLGEGGQRLSGGQRQRLAIARALLKDPSVLLLDEATSALDSESEALVQQALERLVHGRTTLVIAHRLSTVRRAHRIVVLDGGRVVQQGDHQTLLAQGGLYRELYERQFQDQQTAVGVTGAHE